MTNPLTDIMLRFCQGPIALMTYIEGLFHHVTVAGEDVDFLHFMWWPNGDLTKGLLKHKIF